MLEACEISGAESICFGNNGNQIDSGAQSLHHFNVKGLQGMPSGPNEVKTRMHAKVDFVNSAWLLLLQHIRLMLIVQKLDDWHPGVPIVDIVTKARGINDG